jgi:1-deoxy-D-xylulose-5-phosphate reductoisomerase
MAGGVFLAACAQGGAIVLPIDSEHNAVFQCLPQGRADGPGVRRILLTASGGPFRQASAAEMATATPEQACAHPNWSMGRKISVDSATMMNKGLELIEAHYLFGLPESRLDVVVHPQSIVHSLVEYADGSMLAQLGNPDMRTPIAHALAYPERIESGVSPLELARIGRLDFEAPDLSRFPCLRLARQALRAGGGAPCVLNAANEVAVAAFLARKIGFGGIAALNERVLDQLGGCAAPGEVAGVLALDAESRRAANEMLGRLAA